MSTRSLPTSQVSEVVAAWRAFRLHARPARQTTDDPDEPTPGCEPCQRAVMAVRTTSEPDYQRLAQLTCPQGRALYQAWRRSVTDAVQAFRRSR